MSLEMLKADVDAAAQQTQAAADGAAATKPGSHLAGVAAALPGSTSAGAVQALVESWDTAVSEWHRDASGLAERMSAAAEHLQATDEVVSRGFGRPMEMAQ